MICGPLGVSSVCHAGPITSMSSCSVITVLLSWKSEWPLWKWSLFMSFGSSVLPQLCEPLNAVGQQCQNMASVHHALPSSLEGTKTASLINSICPSYKNLQAMTWRFLLNHSLISSEFIIEFTRQNQLLYHKRPGSAVWLYDVAILQRT